MLTVRKEHKVWISEVWVLRRFEDVVGFGRGTTMTTGSMDGVAVCRVQSSRSLERSLLAVARLQAVKDFKPEDLRDRG